MTDGARPEVARVPDAPDPERLFGRLAHLPRAVWLDSADGPVGRRGRSFLAWNPFALLTSRAGAATWWTPAGPIPVTATALDALAGVLGAMRTTGGSPLPFEGGAAGWIGYEVAGEIEHLPDPPPDDHGLPDVHLGFYDVVIGWDHESGACHVISTGRPLAGRDAAERARRRLDETLTWIAGDGPAPRPVLPESAGTAPVPGGGACFAGGPGRPVAGRPGLVSTASPSEYVAAVERIVQAIHAGDVYQVNLSQRFSGGTEATPERVYGSLRRRSPAPHGAVIRAGDATVLSSSPERFLRVWPDGTVEARPIKGTRPRSEDPVDDERLAAELLRSEKDRAENLMIVDLLRNDLSRVCRPGSLSVPELFALESWATVHHLVSSVRGRLRDGVTAADLLRATFPCGSVTGAPRIAAMEMIARLEPVRRGPYCGAIGYFGFGGEVDLSVAIRIVSLRGGRVAFHAGGGVVADSDPDDEYRETLAKARGIVEALAESAPPRGARARGPVE